jgi:lysophospholipase L1-like esterase
MRKVVARIVACVFILRICLFAPVPPAAWPSTDALELPTWPAAGLPARACILYDVVCAEFTWQVADRFMPVWTSWGSMAHPGNYDPSVFRQPFLLLIDACRSTGGTAPLTSYSWTFLPEDSPRVAVYRTTGSCRIRIPLPAEGVYDVSLTVRARDGRAATVMRRVVLRDMLIVSLGDSYASGEGSPEVVVGATSAGEWQDRRCHRSRFSGPAQAALELERRDRQSTVSFLSYACSGATIRQGVNGAYLGLVPMWPPIAPQIRAAATLLCGDDVCDRPEDPTIDVLLISVGGNDVGFSVALMACAARLDDIAARTVRSIFGVDLIPRQECHQQPGLARFLEGRFRELPGLYQELQQETQARLKVRAVFITEYPIDLFDSGDGCGTLELVTAAEAQWLASYGQRLNEIIRNSWRPHEVVSEIAPAFAGHGYCATPTFFGHLGQSIIRQLDYLGLMHPNADGHRVYRDAILRKLQGMTAQQR